MTLLMALAGCATPKPPTDLVLPGGVPARTDLQQASALPPHAARSIARKDSGWRVIYHPARAPADADRRAAIALCQLERKRPQHVTAIPMAAPQDDPGARMIDIHCR